MQLLCTRISNIRSRIVRQTKCGEGWKIAFNIYIYRQVYIYNSEETNCKYNPIRAIRNIIELEQSGACNDSIYRYCYVHRIISSVLLIYFKINSCKIHACIIIIIIWVPSHLFPSIKKPRSQSAKINYVGIWRLYYSAGC